MRAWSTDESLMLERYLLTHIINKSRWYPPFHFITYFLFWFVVLCFILYVKVMQNKIPLIISDVSILMNLVLMYQLLKLTLKHEPFHYYTTCIPTVKEFENLSQWIGTIFWEQTPWVWLHEKMGNMNVKTVTLCKIGLFSRWDGQKHEGKICDTKFGVSTISMLKRLKKKNVFTLISKMLKN